MDDFRLRVFLTAARTLSFTKTAEQLYITQPAVSRHICELESQYKVQLFERRGSRLELTEAGRVMLTCADRLSDEYRRTNYEMGLCTSHVSGELRLGASSTIAQYLLPPILAKFTARFPDVEVTLLSGNSERVERALADHEIDLGMVESPTRRQGFHYASFKADELVLVVRTGGKFAHRESVTVEQLQQIPLVLRENGSGTLEVIVRVLHGMGLRLQSFRIVMRLGTTEGIKRFIRESDAMAIVSVISVVDELRSGTLRIVDVDGVSFPRDFSFVHLAAEPPAPARRFIDFAMASL